MNRTILSAPYTARSGRKYATRGTPEAMRLRLDELNASLAADRENAPTHTGDVTLDNQAEAHAIRKALADHYNPSGAKRI